MVVVVVVLFQNQIAMHKTPNKNTMVSDSKARSPRLPPAYLRLYVFAIQRMERLAHPVAFLVFDLGVDRPQAIVRIELLLRDFNLRKLGLWDVEELLFVVDVLGGLEAFFQRAA